MFTFKRSVLVNYSIAEMYNLVSDIKSYPTFLPWCKSTQVLEYSDSNIQATVEISTGRINKSFTTSNHMQKYKMIKMHLLEGPFKFLEGSWTFEPLLNNTSKVSFELEFEFNNYLMKLAIEPIFKQITNSILDSFCKRATIIYGTKRY